jgi:L-malate glycosyltransferase
MSQRIVFLIDSFTGPWAGTERQLWYLLEGIDRRRFEPHLFLLRHSEYSRSATAWPCPVQVVGVNKLASLDGAKGLAKLVMMMRNLDVCIVHAFFQDASIMGPIAAKLLGARYVAGRRDMGIWYTRWNLSLLKLESRLVDCVIANSNAVRAMVAAEEGIPESRISVIYNGLDEVDDFGHESTILDDSIPPGAPVIGIVANLRPVKRHADLIKAFARVKKTVPVAHLVIAGEGDLHQSLQELATSEGVADSTHFMGRVEAVEKIIRRFTVGVLCSESEGLSNAIMEYLREGKPVVCTNVGGNPELITDEQNGFLYPVGNEDVLVDRLVRILKDSELSQAMGRAALRSIESMTMTNMVRSHMVVYASMIYAGAKKE